MDQLNFISCPAALWRDTEQCQAAMIFIKTNDKCGNKIGDTYFVDSTFFEWFPKDNSTTTEATEGSRTSEGIEK